MTTPHERTEALKNINLHLVDMAYLRTRKERIEWARKLLRHYPTNNEIELLIRENIRTPLWPEPKK